MSLERKEVGPRMSQIVIHGDTVYLAGVVAKNGEKVLDSENFTVNGSIAVTLPGFSTPANRFAGPRLIFRRRSTE